MPLYEYRCDNGHTFEVMQRMSDEPVTTCPECGAAVQRVFHPVAVHFKGSGFYNTDYGKKKKGAGVSEDSGGSSDTKKKESTAKPAKSESSSGSSSSTPSKSD
jgi:putative FmdB family regulatory protein